MSVNLEFNYDETTAAMEVFSQEDIEKLRKWTQELEKSKAVPQDLSDKQLVLFYHACYGDMDKTKLCIEKYYACRSTGQEIFNNRMLSEERLRKSSEVANLFILPGKSCDGYDVIYHRLQDTDPSNFYMKTICKLLFMVIDQCLATRGPQPGHIFLFDMHGVKLGHVARVNLSSLRKFIQYIQEAVPIRMQAIHILNKEPMVDKLMALIKPFMDKKFYNMIKFHEKNEDPEKLYEIVPKTSLPSEYGGSLADIKTLHKKNLEELRLLEPYFTAEEEQRIAILPEKDEKNGVEGTFKSLDID